jgi:hypothetical protein
MQNCITSLLEGIRAEEKEEAARPSEGGRAHAEEVEEAQDGGGSNPARSSP